MKKIYIAGPDVFEKDAVAIGQRYTQLCKEYGFEGLYPLDNVVNFNQPKQKIAAEIFDANCRMIQQADIVIANLNPFRGYEPDSGTVWECGYAYGLGKKVYGYMEDTSAYIQRFKDEDLIKVDETTYDRDGRFVEDFDMAVNLMIGCSVEDIIEGGFEDVLKVLRV